VLSVHLFFRVDDEEEEEGEDLFGDDFEDDYRANAGGTCYCDFGGIF
jgi:hypothetical protein